MWGGLNIGAITGALFSLQFAFQDVASIFTDEGVTFGRVLQTLITVGTTLAFTLQAINAQQLAQGFSSLLGGIKNLPKSFKGINNTFTKFGKQLKGGAGLKDITKTFGKRANRFGPNTLVGRTNIGLDKGVKGLTNFVNKLPKGQLINKAGASVIGRVLATGLTGPVAAAIGAGLAGAAVGKGLGDLIERFTFGKTETIAGFKGREGGRAGSAQLTGGLSSAADRDWETQ